MLPTQTEQKSKGETLLPFLVWVYPIFDVHKRPICPQYCPQTCLTLGEGSASALLRSSVPPDRMLLRRLE